MMSLLTSDDWTAATLTVDFGAAAQVFTPAANENSAYLAVAAFQAWIAASFPGESFTWTWASDATTAGGSITITMANAATIVANAAAQTLTGLAASTGPGLTFTSVWAGTWAPTPQINLTRYVRQVRGMGPASGVGALRSGVPGASPYVPQLEAACTAVEAARLQDILIDAARPRQAHVWQTLKSAWRLLSIGQTSHARIGPLLNTVEIEVLG